ncbi:acireductone synthase [Streptomyces sioyaensis]|uniref:acireductone synthase n=1 Tax=Streptomyces sioyaensis TaxID=67364 RepID=UPI0037A908DA
MSAPAGPPAAVVLDIEGTTGSLTHVHNLLFPYARQRFENWLTAQRNSSQSAELLAAVRNHVGSATLPLGDAIAVLEDWSDTDTKAPPLKTLQAAIWSEGYRNGDLTGHVYPDVPAALERWKAAGSQRYIYSSGAVAAQRDWFAHTAFGDLTPLINGYFDLTTAGGKREPDSYRALTTAIAVRPEATLFVSDVAEELDAAAEAGWQTLAVRRPDDPREAAVPGHRCVAGLHGPADSLLGQS